LAAFHARPCAPLDTNVAADSLPDAPQNAEKLILAQAAQKDV
jgi:hypothetical protein